MPLEVRDSDTSSEIEFEQPYQLFEIQEPTYSRSKLIKKRILDFLRDHYKKLLIVAAILLILAAITIAILSVVISTQNADSRASSKQETKTYEMKHLDCAKVMCSKADCSFRQITFVYATAVKYFCCGCVPATVKLIRFEELPQQDTVNLIVSIQGVDPQNLSMYDLKALKPLPGLVGSWSISIEDGSNYYLKFGSVGLDLPNTSEDDEVSNDSTGVRSN